MRKIIISLIILCAFIASVSGMNITQPSVEYYKYHGLADSSITNAIKTSNVYTAICSGIFAVFYELRSHAFLIEDQNKLLEESNRLNWINMCYVPHVMSDDGYSGYTSNLSELEIECRNAGYPTIVRL